MSRLNRTAPACRGLAATLTLWGSLCGGALAHPGGEHDPDEIRRDLPALAGAERALALARLAIALHDEAPGEALAYGREAAELSEDFPMPELEAPLDLALAEASFHLGDHGAQLSWAEGALAAARARADQDVEWQALVQIAEVQKNQGEYEQALATLDAVREIVDRLGDPGKISRVLGRRGNTYQRQGDFARAMESLHEALEIQRSLDDPRGLAQVLHDTARVYGSVEDYEQSLSYYQEALALTRQLDDRRGTAFNLRNIASILIDLDRGEEALETALQALAEAEALGDRKLEATLLNNIASLLLELERFDEALAWAERAEPAIRVFGLDRWNAVILSNKAEAQLRLGRHREALATLQEALASARKGDVRTLTYGAHELLSETYEALGDPRRALVHHRRFKELYDELHTEESQQRIAELQTRFETAEKDREIADLEHQRELSAAEVDRQRALRNGAVLATVLALGLAGVITASYRMQKRTNRDLRRAYRDLEATHAALAEKKEQVDYERRVSARLREIDSLKDEFLATTSHELRTPLYGITGLAEALLDGVRGELPATARADLAMMVASGRRLSSLVDDILDFSKLKHRSLDLDRRPVDVRSLAEVVLALSRPLAGSKDVELVNAVPPDLPAALADENRVHQVLHNLVANAIKFTESGTIEVAAGVDGDELEVRVSDTGVGIAEEHLERIFNAFEQADASAERRFGGTGLGLAVTRQLVELHGGRLSVTSKLDEGSTFRFTLPVADAEASPVSEGSPELTRLEVESAPGPSAPGPSAPGPAAPGPAAPEPATPGPPAAGGDADPAPHLLIVDDEPVVRQVLANHLALAGYRLTQAASGGEALRLLGEHRFDLVLLDVMMPRMSGYEVCRNLRQSHSLEQLPVIFLTAKSQVSDLIAGLDAGANDYLTKPIAKDELVARVQNHLELLEVHRNLEHLLRERAAQVAERQELIAELEARNVELERFTYTVSHDLKSPLVTIKGFLGLLERDADSGDLERMRHDIERIQAAAERMRVLLDDLLELSRVGRQSNPPERVAVGELACEAVGLVAGSIAERGVEVEVAPDLPVVFGDRLRLLEIFQNLVENAVKYMGDQSSPRIEIGSRSRNGSADVLYVRDNGIGIDPQYHEKVFGLFERLETDSLGTGVGLALVKRIVEIHGGRVWVESRGHGRGSTFCFTLPPDGLEVAARTA